MNRLSINYWNCGAGLLKKLDIIKNEIEKDQPQIFFVAESDLLSARKLGVFQMRGYTFEHSKTLETRISCWFNSTYKRILNLEDDFCEIIVLENVATQLLVVGIYHPYKCYENETTRSNFLKLLTNN